MPSPVSNFHGVAEHLVGVWLGMYGISTPGCQGGNNTTTVLGEEDCPQPAVYLRLLPEAGGRTTVNERGLLQGAPELVAEVCVSRTSYDLHQKLGLYQAAGVNEYVAVLAKEKEARWHRLVEGRYQLQQPDASGVFRSVMFPGLWLDGPALLAGDGARLLATLQDGLRSPEHAAFVGRMRQHGG